MHRLIMTVASFLLTYLTERIGETKLSGFQQAPASHGTDFTKTPTRGPDANMISGLPTQGH